MATSKNFGLIGTGSQIQLGKAGNQVKTGSGIVQARNAADNAFVKVQAADNTLFVDLTTSRYVRTHGKVIATGQIDGGAPPAVVDQAVYIATTTGGAYTAGYLYYGENAAWNEVVPSAGTDLSVSADLTGGTLEFLAGNTYIYAAGVWVNNNPTGVVLSSRATLVFGTSSPLNIGSAFAAASRVLSAYVKVTTAFDGTAPTLDIGVSGDTNQVMDNTEVDLTTVGLYKIDCLENFSAADQLIGTYAADSSTAGAATIEIVYSIA